MSSGSNNSEVLEGIDRGCEETSEELGIAVMDVFVDSTAGCIGLAVDCGGI